MATLAAVSGATGRAAVVRKRGKATATRRASAEDPPSFDPAGQVGALPPIGYFDPLNLCPKGDRLRFQRFREAELKHGRVAMLASVGLLVPHYITFPGYEKVPNGVAAISTAPASYGWFVLLALAGFMELFVWTSDPGGEAGDYGDPLGVNMYDADMRNKELSNGRVAMITTLGILAAQMFTGKDGVDQILDYFPPPAALPPPSPTP